MMPAEVDVEPMVTVYLSLGANRQPEANLQTGVQALQHAFSKVKLSSLYQSTAVNLQGPDFLNMAVKLDCQLNLSDLRRWIADIETQQGRRRDATEADGHTLDIDVLLYGDMIDTTQNIPHKDIYTQAYVLQPLVEIAPELICPKTHQTMLQLWQSQRHWAPTKIIDFEWPTRDILQNVTSKA